MSPKMLFQLYRFVRHGVPPRFVAISISLTLLFTSGCAQRLVTIKYHPLINTKAIANGIGQYYPAFADTGPNEIISIYCISAIENNGKNALDFNFDINRFYVEGGKIIPGGHSWMKPAQSKVVSAHSTVSDLGTITIKHGSSVDPPANNAWIQLKYKSGIYPTTGDQEQVLMIQIPPQPEPLFKQSLDKQTMPLCP